MNLIKYKKTPLSYQITEYDCGQITFLNAVRYLYDRSEIDPKVIKMIMEYTLDQTDQEGNIGKGGTSIYALEFLSKLLREVSNISNMKMNTKILKNTEANINNQEILKCIKNNGVAILRVWQTYEHYVLLTHIDSEYVYLFDPYYLDINYYNDSKECEIIKDRPFEFNRKINKNRLNEFSKNDFSLVDGINREIILITRNDVFGKKT